MINTHFAAVESGKMDHGAELSHINKGGDIF